MRMIYVKIVSKLLIAIMFISTSALIAQNKIEMGDYAAEFKDIGLSIMFQNKVISQASFFSVWEAPAYGKKLLTVGDRFSPNKKDIKISSESDSKTMTMEGRENGVSYKYMVSLFQNMVKVSLVISSETDTKIGAAEYGMLYFTESLVTNRKYDCDGTDIGFLNGAKADKRIAKFSKKLNIQSDLGEIEISGNAPLALCDRRLNWMGGKQAAYAVSATDKLKSDTPLEFTIKVIPLTVTVEPRNLKAGKNIDIPFTDTAPKIDGNLDDNCWKEAVKTPMEFLNKPNAKPSQLTDVLLSWDSKNLYVGFRCFEENMDKVKTQPKGEMVWLNECVEILFDPRGTKNDSKHIILDSYRRIYTSSLSTEGIEAAVSFSDKAWTAELLIPFDNISFSPAAGKSLNINFNRENLIHKEYSTWAPLIGDFNKPYYFGSIYFHKSPVSVSLVDFDKFMRNLYIGKDCIEVNIKNHTNVPQKIIPSAVLSSKSESVYSGPEIELQPFEERNALIPFEVTKESDSIHLSVIDADKKTILYTSPVYPFVHADVERRCSNIEKGISKILKDASIGKNSKNTDSIENIKTSCKKTAVLFQKTILSKEEWDKILKDLDTYERAVAKLEMSLKYNSCPNVCFPEYFVSSRHEMQKIFREDNAAKFSVKNVNINMEGCGNEYVNYQLLIVPIAKDILSASISCTNLSDANGKETISAENIKFHPVEYIDNNGPMWPDILTDKDKFNVSMIDKVKPA